MRFAVRSLLFCSLAFFTSSTFAAIYVRISGLPGNSLQQGFTNYFDAIETGQATIACSGACFTLPGDFKINMAASTANPQLQIKMFQKTIIPAVDIVYARIAGGGIPVVYYQVHLENVIVKSISEVGESAEGVTTQFSFGFTQIGWKYSPQSGPGGGSPVSSCWNVAGGSTTGCNLTFPF